MAERVLFTCVGTSDPVREMRDGSMLHIMRHYRPKKVYIFLSKEMEDFEKADHRLEKTFCFVNEKWADDTAEAIYEYSGLLNVADMDAVADPLFAFFEKMICENPDSQVLINLSSGTPQMKTVLAQLAVSSRHGDIRGIQVANPSGKSGKSGRTNEDGYDVQLELELNEDEAPDAPNRCSEPRLFAIQRDRARAQIGSLLARRDYRALEAVGDQLPPDILPLIRHLAARNDLQTKEAYQLARTLSLPFELYPAKRAAGKEYRELSEYYLLLRNLQLTGRYSEFVLRLNPFLTHLMARQIEMSLPEDAKGVIERQRNGRIRFCADVLRRKLPAAADELDLDRRCAVDVTDSELSLFVGVRLLRVLGRLPKHVLCKLEACESLNSMQRNPTAHQLHAVMDEDIKRACVACVDGKKKAYGSDKLVQIFGDMLEKAYPDVCDKELFTVYDRCGDYISQRL